MKHCTSERVDSAMRQRMKQNKPNSIVITRKALVLQLKFVLLVLGSRSACVTAILSLSMTLVFVGVSEF
jgi:hypothetical protein